MESQRPYREDDDWSFTISEDRTVNVDFLVTIHPAQDQGLLRARNLTFAWFASDFQAKEYQTDLLLRTVVTENKTSGFYTVAVFFATPKGEGYKFVVTFSLKGRIETVAADPETYKFSWRYGLNIIHAQRVTVRLPPHHTLLSTTAEQAQKGVEDGLEILRFNGPLNSIGFAWSITYTRVPLTLIENITSQVQAHRDFLGVAGSALGVSATALGYMLRTRKRRLVKNYLNTIDSVFNSFFSDKERCRAELVSLREKIDLLFRQEKIDELQHGILTKKAEWYLEKL